VSTRQNDLFDTTGPNAPALSRDDRQLVDDLVGIVDDLPTLEHEELVDQFFEEHGEFSFGHGEAHIDGYKKKYEPARGSLPSFGEKQEDCGVGIPHVCEHCGHTVEIGRTCRQSMCPRCWAAWVMKRAEGIVARIMSAAKMKDGAQYKHHGVISPPEELYIDADHPEQAFLDAVADMMDVIDMDGIALYHPWTGDESDAVDEETGDDRGEWKHRIGGERSWHGDVREELKHRPHAHVIGATEHFPGGDVTSEVYDETGWILHRITERNGSPISLKDATSVARAVCYSLSHTMIDTRRGEDSGQGDPTQNTYVHTTRGSAYHKPTNDLEDAHPSHADNLRDAKEAVYNVAPDVLGVSTGEIECQTTVERLEDADKEHDVSEHLDDEDGAGVDDQGDDLENDGGATTTVKCRGDMVDVDDADFVEEEDWQRTAEHADQAVDAREAWKEAGGWQGWSGQATLDGQRLEDVEGDPPPD